MASDNKTIGRFQLTGIPPAPRGVPQIQVTFDIDSNGIVSVSARDLGTGKEQVVRVTAAGGLKDADIERIIAEAETQRQEDAFRKELAESKVQAESLIYTSQKAVDEYGSAVHKEDLEVIRADIAELEMAIQGSNIEQINEARVRLEESAYRIAEAMYAGVGAAAAADTDDSGDALTDHLGAAVSDAISESLDDGKKPKDA